MFRKLKETDESLTWYDFSLIEFIKYIGLAITLGFFLGIGLSLGSAFFDSLRMFVITVAG